MHVHEAGLPLDRVLDLLREARARDFTYADGEILGSMCTAPDPIALEAWALFHETNLGDPGHFTGTKQLETEYLQWVLGLAHAPDGAEALFTSGGTEGNLVAVHAARAAWREKTGARDTRVNIIVPEAAHFSFEKAARLTDIELRHAAIDDRHRVRPDAVAGLVDDRTALIVGIAGTTEVGALDPLQELSDMAVERDVPLHVDAALGGFILPFLDDAGRTALPWDFQLKGVTSITMDPHKMGTAPIPGGALLVRDAKTLQRIAVDTPYITTHNQSGILGTRPGAAAAAAWAVAARLGRAGYARTVRRCLDDADWLRSTLERRGVAYFDASLNVVLIRCGDPVAVQQALDARGWRVNAVPRLGAVRIVVMPHVQRAHLERFLPDLFDVLQQYPAPGQSVDALRRETC